MARYSFSSLDDDAAVSFDPARDVFVFDNWFITPDSVSVLSRSASVVISAHNRRVTLIGVTVEQLNSENVFFVGYDLSDEAAAPIAA